MSEIKTVTLEELIGPHFLSGVQPGTMPKGEYQESNPNTLTVVLDDVAYMIIEDPNDGYRSSMDAIQIADLSSVANRFEPVHVVGTKREKHSGYNTPDILDIIDVQTGIVLSLGTDNSDDYYPTFVADWHPENLVLNAVAK